MRQIMFTGLLFTVFAVPALAAPCMGLNATYEIKDAEGFSLTFKKATEALAWSDLEAVVKTPLRSIEFGFTASNGYSFNYLVPKEANVESEENERSYEVYVFNEKSEPLSLPQSSEPAPAMIFAPSLGSSLWYGSEPREFLPIAMWKLKSCS